MGSLLAQFLSLIGLGPGPGRKTARENVLQGGATITRWYSPALILSRKCCRRSGTRRLCDSPPRSVSMHSTSTTNLIDAEPSFHVSAAAAKASLMSASLCCPANKYRTLYRTTAGSVIAGDAAAAGEAGWKEPHFEGRPLASPFAGLRGQSNMAWGPLQTRQTWTIPQLPLQGLLW